MSWIVQTLLNNRNIIKSRILDNFDVYSDEYNDLITIEKAIESLVGMGKISSKEMDILTMTGSGETVSMIAAREKGKRDWSLSRKYEDVCNRIAFYLGGYFTDEGYLDHMKTKYNLTESAIDALRQYMSSKLKHKIKRKPIQNDKSISEEM